MIYIISYSAGKDSTALWLWARRTQLSPRRIVACDTRWESKLWLPYLRQVEGLLGEPVAVVSAEVGFAERVRKHNTFPGRLNRRWCTQELKLEPFRDEVDRIREETGDDVTVVVGVRAEESEDRAKMPEREWSDFYDCEVWRPLITWTLEQVIAEHHEANIPLNPLYLTGAERVGCYPCIKAGKVELRHVARHEPERIEEIRELERETNTTMFCLEAPRRKGSERKLIPTPIDEMIKWAQTERGGHRLMLPMFQEPSGCARWGICERPTKDGDE